ncbi:MAG: acyl-CoA desaturase, partial [Aeromicrobium sp.]|nr:acyl-CoA desaturase [Aeromicrobium sp.]
MTKNAPIKARSAHDHNEAPLSLVGPDANKRATIGLEYMSYEQLDEFGHELNAVRQRVLDDLGQKDANYIRRVIKVQRASEVLGRIGIFMPLYWPAFVAGILFLGLSKILDNMEIGH